MINNRLSTIALLFFSAIIASISAQSQDVIATSGESFEKEEGSISWTLGEVAVDNYENGTLSEGFQQVVLSVTSSTNNLPAGVKIYPNPVVQTLSIENNAKNYTLNLYDINGAQLLSKKCNATSEIDFTQYSTGQYFLTLVIDKNTYSFTVQKN